MNCVLNEIVLYETALENHAITNEQGGSPTIQTVSSLRDHDDCETLDLQTTSQTENLEHYVYSTSMSVPMTIATPCVVRQASAFRMNSAAQQSVCSQHALFKRKYFAPPTEM